MAGWKDTVRSVLAKAGASVDRSDGDLTLRFATTPASRALTRRVAATRPHTMTSPARLIALSHAVQRIVRDNVPGDLVECGVAAGGSAMMMALTLLEENVQRDIWLYDTFEGLPEPGEHDVDHLGRFGYGENVAGGMNYGWTRPRRNMHATGYPDERVHWVRGLVEDTIPATLPDTIALLRLDTDFESSTRHELAHLYPRLAPGGVLIVDDYGHFPSVARAVDEFNAALDRPFTLTEIDYTGRIAVKP